MRHILRASSKARCMRTTELLSVTSRAMLSTHSCMMDVRVSLNEKSITGMRLRQGMGLEEECLRRRVQALQLQLQLALCKGFDCESQLRQGPTVAPRSMLTTPAVASGAMDAAILILALRRPAASASVLRRLHSSELCRLYVPLRNLYMLRSPCLQTTLPDVTVVRQPLGTPAPEWMPVCYSSASVDADGASTAPISLS